MTTLFLLAVGAVAAAVIGVLIYRRNQKKVKIIETAVKDISNTFKK